MLGEEDLGKGVERATEKHPDPGGERATEKHPDQGVRRTTEKHRVRRLLVGGRCGIILVWKL